MVKLEDRVRRKPDIPLFQPKKIEWKETKKEIKAGKGGEPGAKGCPQCKNMFCKPLKKTYKGCRTYKCLRCKAIFASPTEWAECLVFGLIGKDLIVHDCLVCPWAKAHKIDVRKQTCPNYKKRVYFDEY